MYWHASILSETRIVIVLRGRLILYKILFGIASIVEQIFFFSRLTTEVLRDLLIPLRGCFVVLGVDLQLAAKGIF